MVTCLRIAADVDEPIELIDIESDDEYRRLVDGWTEAVDVPALGISIYVNEEGLVRRLPFNARASAIWWANCERLPDAMLVGDAVVVGYPDDDGKATDVPAETVALLTQPREYAVMIRLGSESERIGSGSRFNAVLLPFVAGNPNWLLSSARYEDYFSAALWSVALSEHRCDVGATKVVPSAQLPGHLAEKWQPQA
ncbi:DUF3846 domain-containing protein [Pseudoclavibacter sp. AY1F1]|uniref:DUF3846 domain-containing protein n=1 Tax=Pseudoclavibacter sp. AY1F1 TaxID=2080583 RepID=UPI0015E48248|nr:DUF3846 domain-containing protein [Pseudoclavibacter sp. AY1F1]